MMLSLMREDAGDADFALGFDLVFEDLVLTECLVEGEYDERGRSSNVSRGVEKRMGEGQRASYAAASSASEESDMHSSCTAIVECRA